MKRSSVVEIHLAKYIRASSYFVSLYNLAACSYISQVTSLNSLRSSVTSVSEGSSSEH